MCKTMLEILNLYFVLHLKYNLLKQKFEDFRHDYH